MAIAPFRKKYLGEVLLTGNLITKDQLKECLAEQQDSKDKLGTLLIKKGYVTEEDVLRALAVCYRIPYVRIFDYKEPERELLRIVSEKLARKFLVVPLVREDGTVKVAMADPSNMAAVDEVEHATGMRLSVMLASEKEIHDAIQKYYSQGLVSLTDENQSVPGEMVQDIENLDEGSVSDADSAPIIKYVNALLYEAVSKGASDIHLEPQEKNASLRLRIDGELIDSAPPPRQFLLHIISRIKILSNLDIAERRLPQDGKSRLKLRDKSIDIRVSTLPTIHGEKVVMRLLDRSSISLKLDDLGYFPRDAQLFRESLERPYGMLLCTGPTGSGKTTTLYTGLNYINTRNRNIVTVEDPVEYELLGINQVQIKPQIDLTFANVLRSVLRQDPDVIMIGEIRDRETAEIAIQSALTGHLVLSTLHTNDAISSLTRMAYMGIDSMLIADAVSLVMAQRLVRRICIHCKREVALPDEVFERLHIPSSQRFPVYAGAGCDKCFNSGYRGRTSIVEMAQMTQDVRKLLIADKGDIAIKEQAQREGMRTLREDAIERLKAGVTTVEEVLSVTNA